MIIGHSMDGFAALQGAARDEAVYSPRGSPDGVRAIVFRVPVE
ncbi:MAG: hypothetical protein ACSHX3_11605 [Litorimonas sp.]